MNQSWLNAHRLSRPVFVAVVLAVMLVWALWNRGPAMTSRAEQVGHVVSLTNDRITEIELAGGKHVRTLTPNPAPKPGDAIPMIVETYEDGSVYVYIDVDAWQVGLTN